MLLERGLQGLLEHGPIPLAELGAPEAAGPIHQVKAIPRAQAQYPAQVVGLGRLEGNFLGRQPLGGNQQPPQFPCHSFA